MSSSIKFYLYDRTYKQTEITTIYMIGHTNEQTEITTVYMIGHTNKQTDGLQLHIYVV